MRMKRANDVQMEADTKLTNLLQATESWFYSYTCTTCIMHELMKIASLYCTDAKPLAPAFVDQLLIFPAG